MVLQWNPERRADDRQFVGRGAERTRRNSSGAYERKSGCDYPGIQTQELENTAVEWRIVRRHESRALKKAFERWPEAAKVRGVSDVSTFDAMKSREAKVAPSRAKQSLQASIDTSPDDTHGTNGTRALRPGVSSLEVNRNERWQSHTTKHILIRMTRLGESS